MSATPPPGTVQVSLDDQTRVLRAALCRNDRFLTLSRFRHGRYPDPIGQLNREEAIRLHRGIGSLIALMPEETAQ